MLERLARAGAGSALDLDYDSIRLRVVRVVGLLLDLPLRRVEDVGGVLRELLARR